MYKMQISEFLAPDMVMPSVDVCDKKSLLAAMVSHAARFRPDALRAETSVLDAIWHREDLGCTGVGDGVAIPHARLSTLDDLYGVFARVPQGVHYDSLDGCPVRLVFMLLVPDNIPSVYLKALARVSRLLKDDVIKEELLSLDDTYAIHAAMTSRDEEI